VNGIIVTASKKNMFFALAALQMQESRKESVHLGYMQ
jgi:hypothetical protein